jgi:hypothetical protein
MTTFYPIDSDSTGADQPFGWQLRRCVENYRACMDDRQPCVSHAYFSGGDPSANVPKYPIFSTPSDRYLHIPIIWYPERGCNTVTARVDFELEDAGGKVRLRHGDNVGTAVSVTDTDTTAEVTLDVSDVGKGADGNTPTILCLEFRSDVAASVAFTVNVLGQTNNKILAIEDPGTSDVVPGPGHYQLELSDSLENPFVHVVHAASAQGQGSHDHDFRVDRSLSGDIEIPEFDVGYSSSENVYKMGKWTLKGWELEVDGNASSLLTPLHRSLGSGQRCKAGDVTTLHIEGMRMVGQSMRWLSAGPLVRDQYGFGRRIDATANQNVAGAMTRYNEDMLGVTFSFAMVAFRTEDDDTRLLQRTFDVTVENLTSASTQTGTLGFSQDERQARVSGYANQTGAAAASAPLEEYAQLDMGQVGEEEMLVIREVSVGFADGTFSASAGDLLKITVVCDEGSVAIPCCTIRERF